MLCQPADPQISQCVYHLSTKSYTPVLGDTEGRWAYSKRSFISVLEIQVAELFTDNLRDAAQSSLDGHLIAVKDNICIRNEPTTCASKMLDGFISPFTATVVEKLRDAGALIAGKTNLDEFGMGFVSSKRVQEMKCLIQRSSHSTNSFYGPVRSHILCYQEPRSAGGSSGGSAVATATGQCFA